MQKKFSLSSMTAYGQGEAVSKEGRFAVEIQSLNRRYLEVQVSLPMGNAPLEAELRRLVAESVHRGQVQVSLNWQKEGGLGITPNLALAQELKASWEAIAAELEVDAPFDLKLLQGEKELFVVQESALPKKPILEAVETALEALLEMKRAEGEKLAADLASRARFLEKAVAEIEKGAASATDRFREKLTAKLAELSLSDDERVVKEVAILAERSDVTEEIVRFRIHLEKFQETLCETAPVGKKLDFLLQELIRESNTMGAKGQLVVEIKSELEKMREQVQNIE